MQREGRRALNQFLPWQKLLFDDRTMQPHEILWNEETENRDQRKLDLGRGMKELEDLGEKFGRALRRFVVHISIVSVFGMAFMDGKNRRHLASIIDEFNLQSQLRLYNGK